MPLDFFASRRYQAAENQSEYGAPTDDPYGDGLYRAAEASRVASERLRPATVDTTNATEWRPASEGGTLVTPQPMLPAVPWKFRGMIPPVLVPMPAVNHQTQGSNFTGFFGSMPLDAQPFLERTPPYQNPNRRVP